MKPTCIYCGMEIGMPHTLACQLLGYVRALDTESQPQRQEDDLLRAGGPVNHPKHYNEHPAGIECIDVIEHMTLNIGTAVKYVWRAGLKEETYQGADETQSAVRDLRSAIWYIEREIERITQPFTMRKGSKAK